MDIQKVDKEVLKAAVREILREDPSILKSALKEIIEEKLAAGKKRSDAEHLNFLKESETQIENGKFITLDDLIQESKGW